jgi:hypothetical protein
MLKSWRFWVLTIGTALGVGLTAYIPYVDASRNSGGTYSLPSGNPVVTGTTITSTWANNTLSDISTELTNSLDRQGRGSMSAPLQHSSGSCAAPSITFSADTDIGFWRSAANTMQACVASTAVLNYTTTGVEAPVVFTTQAGITATQSTTNGNAITGTANGTGVGVLGIATTTAGSAGVRGTTTTRTGVDGTATSGNAVTGTATTGFGVTGVATSGDAVTGAASSSGRGGVFSSVSGIGLEVGTGNMKMTASNPLATASQTNTLAPSSLIKAWGQVVLPTTIQRGFNFASVTTATGGGCNDDYIEVNLGTTLTSGEFGAVCTFGESSVGVFCTYDLVDSDTLRFRFFDSSFCTTDPSGAIAGSDATFIVMGYQ